MAYAAQDLPPARSVGERLYLPFGQKQGHRFAVAIADLLERLAETERRARAKRARGVKRGMENSVPAKIIPKKQTLL